MSLTVVKGWRDLPAEVRGASVALGNFDGVHRGHRRVIADAAQAAARLKAPLGVISFDPHPRRLFQPDAEPFHVMSLGQQARALEALGVDLFYVLPFDAEMAAMSDHAFAEQVLAQGLGARHVAVGFDVTYGKGRTGSPQSLAEDGRRLGFSVSVAERAADDRDVKYSSSAVRDALKAGRPEEAGEILGRPFAIEGQVVHGDKRGRTIGFPTLNVSLSDYVRPAFGVYATRTRLEDGREVPGVSNLGRRPTVNGADERLETHLFDFDEDLYGQTVETALLAFLRPEQKFDGLDALKAQIAADAQAARDLLLPPL
ncbi:bifunctional riboflavin kinase/FAD synthetase [Caulobacter sp. 17J80-11]|uniref:bifunctional riboflavin kinase/FAD synthetase n=1 Tax=Caulobacter sp. 17J80-11 TaxID=2763502 RepID=UPI0016534BDB|nr:bifunctional riboflavin kinase/FAD synthetase [Caulobacter sp. 17J80-11]MBC6981022.1 bifunctional riboflavin kinase/FAD synthetase [Caulobacter sp. 17J80-11]